MNNESDSDDTISLASSSSTTKKQLPKERISSVAHASKVKKGSSSSTLKPRMSQRMIESKRRISIAVASDSDFEISNDDGGVVAKSESDQDKMELVVELPADADDEDKQDSKDQGPAAKKLKRAPVKLAKKLLSVVVDSSSSSTTSKQPKKKNAPIAKIDFFDGEEDEAEEEEYEKMKTAFDSEVDDEESEFSEFVHSSAEEEEEDSDEEEVDELAEDAPILPIQQVVQRPRPRARQPRGGGNAGRARVPNQFEQMLVGGGADNGAQNNNDNQVQGEGENNDGDGNENASEDEEGNPAPVRAVRRRAAAPRKSPEELRIAQNEKLWVHHPELRTVWDELAALPKIEIPEHCPQPNNVVIKLLPFQLEGVHWLQKQETSRFNGGILADEMGMGKTIQIIGLIVSNNTVKPNLILTPTVAILQWFSELRERVTPDLLKICVFHGTSRETNLQKLKEYDVVLSTYAIVESLFRKQQSGFKRKGEMVKEDSILHKIQWGRVILDEAHSIKDRSSSTARAVFNLNAQYKWSVSGTPLQNRVGELYSLIRFLDADPFSNYFCKQCPCKMKTWNFSNRRHCDECGHISHMHFCWWNAEILKPIQNYGGTGEGLIAFNKLGILLDRIMLRRTKIERADDLGLPPRVIVVRRDVFNQAEEELYASLYDNSKRQFSTYVASNTVLNNYASIFSLLSRMRLAVNHPLLVTTKLDMKANQATESLVCGLCQEVAEDAILSKCKHVFCREDVREYMFSCPDGQTCNCPVCFKPLSIDLSQQEYEGTGAAKKEGAKTSIVNYIDMSKWRSSTKIEALVEELTTMQRQDATMKSIVFSQFVAFLDLIHWRLSRAGFNCVKLDGRMTPQSREAVISSFMKDPNVTIFLVSLKAGGVALNLTEASRVFILDPWWNPAVEDQAFDRIHRLGQHRPIRITRLIIENSIESRILQVQEKKKMLFQSTVGKDMDALAKLSEEDLSFLFTL
ncbi:UNVERIFIED_CONTAM: DNA repair protein rad16 [Siphonaria sp. JEL0065]|nr:DNA repair protein rad16 [Siphonaria sp. JEL0065]